MENQRAWRNIEEELPRDGSVIWELRENGLEAIATYHVADVEGSTYGFISRIAFTTGFTPTNPVCWRYDN
jgi:hypothetical protein